LKPSPALRRFLGGIRFYRIGGCGSVSAIPAGHYFIKGDKVVKRSRYGAYLVKRGGIGNKPIPRDSAIGRLEAIEPTESGRLTDRAAGIAAKRYVAKAGRYGCGRTARRAPGHIPFSQGVLHRAIRGVFVRRAHRKLIAVCPADADSPGRFEPFYDCRIVWRDKPLQNPRSRTKPMSRYGDIVFMHIQ
jgi:hypothetical protein